MRHKFRDLSVFFLLFLILAPVIGVEARTYSVRGEEKPFIMQGRLEVQFESSVDGRRLARGFDRVSFGVPSLDLILDRYRVSAADQIFPWRKPGENTSTGEDMSRFYELIFPEDVDLTAITNALRQNPNVRSVAPVYAQPLHVIPNDTYYGSQWYLSKVMAQSAWDMEKGSDTAKIAIIDSGVLYSHPDLIDKIWVNPGEDRDSDFVVYDVDDLNGIDDDGNGVIDDLIGYDFFNSFGDVTCWPGEDCSGPDSDPKDYNGHGTHCAGISGAVSNNSLGAAGIAGGWGGGKGPYSGPRIICIRVGGSAIHPTGGYEAGYVSTPAVASGIDYAVTVGATVINCSWGSSDTPAMRAAVNRAVDSGVVIVHSAGNEPTGTGDFLDYYSRGGQQAAISVASTNGSDQKSDFSNYGYWVDICAPGENIYNTYSNHYSYTYASLYGTSMSTPIVVGLAALIKSHMPHFKKPEIDTVIIFHADTIDYLNPGYEGMLGAGRVNVCSSLAIFPVASFTGGPSLMGPAPLTVNFTDQSPDAASSWLWNFGDGGTDFIQNPTHIYTQPGMFGPSMTIETARGPVTEVLKNMVMVTADTIRVEPTTMRAGQKGVIPVYLSNRFREKAIILAYAFSAGSGLKMDSFSVAGTRTSYFQDVKYLNQDDYNLRYVLSMRPNLSTGSSYLPPGTGTIVKFYVTDTAAVPTNRLVTIDTTTISGRKLKLESIYGDYVPVFHAGQLQIALYARGDANGNGLININDITYLINALYKGGPPPDPFAGDVDASGLINIKDVTYLINFLYKSGPPPPE